MAKRRKVIPPPTERMLILLAGIPLSIGPGVVAWLEEYLPGSPKIVAVPGQERDGYLYRPAYVEQCLEAASSYAERVSRTSKPQPAPNALALAYVPDDSDHILLDAFSFSAFPIPLLGLESYSFGKQIRHHAPACKDLGLQLIRDAAIPMGRIRQRLTDYSPKEPLFLPPLNFEIEPGIDLSAHFKELRDGVFSWQDAYEVSTTRASHADLPKHAGPFGLNVSVDARALLFPRDLSGHGGVRELEDLKEQSSKRQSLLRTLYRFGAPLPEALHHDVQYAGGRTLDKTELICAVKGRFTPDCDYANIYPDDFVRPSAT